MPFNDTSNIVEQGCDFAETGDHPRAIELFKVAIERGESWVGLNLGNSYVALGDVAAAEQAFETAWHSGDDDAGFNLGRLLEDQGQIERARAVYGSLIQRDYVKAMVEESNFLREEGRDQKSEELLTRAMEDPGPDGDAAAGILGHLRYHGRGSAEELLRRGAASYPSARADLAELLIETNRLEEGIAMLRTGAAANETESLLPLGNYLAETGDLEGAEASYKRGFALGDAHAATNLGSLRWEQGRRKSARKWIARGALAGDAQAATWLDESRRRKQ